MTAGSLFAHCTHIISITVCRATPAKSEQNNKAAEGEMQKCTHAFATKTPSNERFHYYYDPHLGKIFVRNCLAAAVNKMRGK